MKVTAVTPFIVDPGYGKNWLFVKVETSDGLHGWGECYTQADRDQAIATHVRQIGRYLLGRDAGHIRHFTHWAYHDFAGKRGAMDFWSAVSGIEQALWDLAGKRLGVPVVALLGGPCRERIRVYANGWYTGARTPDAYAAKARDTVARGFTTLKFDPFPGPWRTHISRDAERQVVETVRATKGHDRRPARERLKSPRRQDLVPAARMISAARSRAGRRCSTRARSRRRPSRPSAASWSPPAAA